MSGEAEDEVDASPEEVSVRKIPTEADFLMAYSVIPGKLRQTSFGRSLRN